MLKIKFANTRSLLDVLEAMLLTKTSCHLVSSSRKGTDRFRGAKGPSVDLKYNINLGVWSRS